MNPALGQVETAVHELGLQISPQASERFDAYLREVLAWASRIGLTASITAPEVVGLHFVDSLLPLAIWDFPPGCRVVDVGSGAGFPGMPLKVARPDLRLTLVDASRRRVAFLERLRATLGLDEVEIVWGRAEELGHHSEHRSAYERSVERATARLGVSAELCLPLVRPGGASIFLKGPTVYQELSRAGPLIEALGGRVEACVARPLPTTDRRRVTVVISKVRAPASRFPRRGPRLGAPP